MGTRKVSWINPIFEPKFRAMKKTVIVRDLKELPEVAKTILRDLGEHRVVALFGKMGSGKTTLIKSLCKALDVQDVVSSPTFALVNEYQTALGDPVYHFDFYRIETIEEVFDIGYEEYIYSGNYCFIEWPEMIESLLPESYVRLDIEEEAAGVRKISYGVVED